MLSVLLTATYLSLNQPITYGPPSYYLVRLLEPKRYEVFVTSYNAHAAQTDSSPCIGAGLVDICDRARSGERVIALSQDLVGRASWKPFTYGDRVRLESDNPQCSGEFTVLDTMNERHRRRADLFFLDRRHNTSCSATLYQLPLSPL